MPSAKDALSGEMKRFVSTNRVLTLRKRSNANRLLDAIARCSPSLSARGSTLSESAAAPREPSGESAQAAASARAATGKRRRNDMTSSSAGRQDLALVGGSAVMA